MTLTASEVHQMKYAQPSTEGVLPVVLERWSPRAFADRDVSPADLKKIFEAARWAPSSFNEQPWRFIVGHRNSETYKKIADALVPANQAWASTAPVLSLSVAKTRFSNNDSPITMHSTISAQPMVSSPCRPLRWASQRTRWRALIRPRFAKPLPSRRYTRSGR